VSRQITFNKIQATLNDFVVVDGRAFPLEWFSEEVIHFLCHRQKGVGADGLIILEPEDGRPGWRMHYFNSDGTAASMCGNGLRASALFVALQEHIEYGQEFVLHSDEGKHRVSMENAREATVELKAAPQQNVPKPELLYLPDKFQVLGFEHTGVPHLVIETKEELDTHHIREWGRRLRYDPLFLPQGTNVDFVRRISENELLVRTYERGVENETYSCGTGAVASAVAFWKKNKISANEIYIRTRGGTLKVSRSQNGMFLTGPVHQVFTGKIEI